MHCYGDNNVGLCFAELLAIYPDLLLTGWFRGNSSVGGNACYRLVHGMEVGDADCQAVEHLQSIIIDDYS